MLVSVLLLLSCDFLGRNTPPIAGFLLTPEGGFAPLSVTFDASASLDPDGSIRKYQWEFGDGSKGQGIVAEHSYEDDGEYTVSLTVKDNQYASSVTQKTMEVLNPPPVPDIDATAMSGQSPLTVMFDASSSYDASGVIESYVWDFDDGTTGQGALIEHTFQSATPREFEVKLTATDNDGASSSVQISIHVSSIVGNLSPVARFTMSPTEGTAPAEIRFNASGSEDPDGSITSYTWEFGDGDVTTGQVVSHVFLIPDSYAVRLTVVDSEGATSTVQKTLLVAGLIPTPPPPPG